MKTMLNIMRRYMDGHVTSKEEMNFKTIFLLSFGIITETFISY